MHGRVDAFGIPHEQQAMRRLLVQRQLSDLQTGGRDSGIGSPSEFELWHISRSCATRSFHWRMRSQLKYSVLQMRRSALLLGSPSA